MFDIDSKVLLKSGTNELEMLEFRVGKQTFGINIAKVSEIMRYIEPITIPNSDDIVEGIISPRGTVITVVDLHRLLKKEIPENNEGILIVCNFNQLNIAFHVTSVIGIQRISWEDIKKPPSITANENEVITGLATIHSNDGDRITLILDFEKIVSDINSCSALDVDSVVKVVEPTVSSQYKIVVAEDSVLLNKLVVESLRKAGYTNISSFQNGEDAYNYIQSKRECENIKNEVSCLITDIEMPRMDGHRLTKLIKDDQILKTIPVILFSSLINDQMMEKGKSVGADAQYSKPEIKSLIDGLQTLL